jgi:hypothetical protein
MDIADDDILQAWQKEMLLWLSKKEPQEELPYRKK